VSLPVGIEESLRRVDEGLAASESDLQGLSDLIDHSTGIPPSVSVLVQRKRSALGFLRQDLQGIPERLGGPS
jgi:hypothetical protein